MSFGKRTKANSASNFTNVIAFERPGSEFPGERNLPNGLKAIKGNVRNENSSFSEVLALIEASPHRGHRPSMLSEIGALTGFAAQQAIWQAYIYSGRAGSNVEFWLKSIDAPDGATYFYGEFLNRIMFTTEHQQLSVWRIVASAALAQGATGLPNMPELAQYVNHTIINSGFGVPALVPILMPRELPVISLRRLWKPARDILVRNRVDPLHWPLELAVGAQKLVEKSAGSVAPDSAARIVMEAAVPMSHVDPMTVPGADRSQCGVLST